MELETKQPELDSLTALNEKMYQLGYEDAKNNRTYGESITQEGNIFTVNGTTVEQLTLF